MHAAAAGLAGGPEARQIRRARQVGHDAAALVVGRGRDRQPVRRGVQPRAVQVGVDRGEASVEVLQPGGVEPNVVRALVDHRREDAAGHDVAGQELVDEAVAVRVAQHGAVATQRLGQQRTRDARVVEGGRMELEELQVRDGHPGAQCHRHAVSGGDGRVGRDREQLSGTTRGEQHVTGPDLVHDALGVDGAHSHAAPVLDHQVEGEGVLVQRCGRAADRRDERPFDLGARRRTAGVHDTGDRVAAFAGQLQVAALVAVELGAQRDELLDATGALVDQDAHGVDVAQAGSRGEGVGEVQVDLLGVARQGGGDAALGPPRGGQVETALGDHTGAQTVSPGGLDGGGEPGHPGAEHEQVELARVHVAGPGAAAGASPPGPPTATSSPAERLSISRARPKRTAANSREVSSATSSGARVAGSATST